MHEDWLARWREGRIGFHEGQPNRFLDAHHARLGGRRRVLVPLCGKAEDLAFLAATSGHQVVGVELAEQAAQEFFAEHGLEPEISRGGDHVTYRAGAIAIHVGDFFAVTPALVGPIDALYDRAALIALPPERRVAYAELVRRLVAPGSPGLVITLEYDQAVMDGPPFSVREAELRTLYAGFEIELVDEAPAVGGGKLAQTGTPAMERCFAMRFS